ncbi:MAG: heme ABC transporter ATP-binding protein [Chloroflexi bacterium]|nr:heme ABC transporter ATP-binding protein [Chloroflexota bacterium]
MNPIHLRGQDITFSYNHKPVLDGISIQVLPGEIVGLLGPNGSGKSTLIKLLSRVLVPQDGRVWIDGHELSRLGQRQIARRIAVVPQVFEMPTGFTAFEVVLMGRTPHLSWLQSESACDREIARAAMLATGTWSLADRYVDQLSGGERQRVIIARALAQEPQVLLLDEATAHLDVRHQIEIMEIVQRFARERELAVLIIFHDLNLAAQYCDRIVLLKDGKVFANGSPREVITREGLRAVYGVEMCVFPHPDNQLPAALIASK